MAGAVLASRRDAGGALYLLGMDVGKPHASAYDSPGQYVEISTPRGNGYFVLSGPLGASRWEFLVRDAGEAAAFLIGLPLGAEVNVSLPLGKGFPMDRAVGKELVVALVGSAVSVARPIVSRRVAENDASRTTVFVGVRAPRDVPLAEEVEAWTDRGVRVVMCLSRSTAEDDTHVVSRAERQRGYVQAVLAREVDSRALPHRTMVFAAGPEGMLNDLRALAHREGMPEPVLEVVSNA